MRILDTFCKAGGASMGYHRAGFEVVGVDIEPQKNYPFEFHQGDAIEFIKAHGHEFDAIAASPPCQAFSAMTKRWIGRSQTHPDLVKATRQALVEMGKPYVIENVPGAPLINPILLCGTMFGLQTSFGSQLRRHRLFECSFPFESLIPPCQHNDGSCIGVYGGGQHPDRRVRATIGVYGQSGPGAYSTRDKTHGFGVEERREAMGIEWMTGKELSQAIPPAYTKFIGLELMSFLESIK